MSSNLSDFERAVLAKTFQGSHPALGALREQLEQAEVLDREFTGVGFFTSFRVSGDAPRAKTKKDRIGFGDVVAELEGLDHGAGFVLFIDDGYLEMLEGYCFEETWPSEIGRYELRYDGNHEDHVAAYFIP